MASQLTLLPTEVKRLIFGSLTSTDLRALCLTSKALQVSAEPLLYRDICWTWTQQHPVPPIPQLLRNLSRRPALAGQVRSLSLLGSDAKQFRQTRLHIPVADVTDGDWEVFDSMVQRTEAPYGTLWSEGLRSGSVDAFVSLFLAQLPNLTSLRLDYVFAQQTRLLGMMLRCALCEPRSPGLPAFHSLREVHFTAISGTDRGSHNANTADILPLLYLPTVRSISASIDNPQQFQWPAQPPSPAALATLDLTEIREMHLGQVLSVTKGLECLKWEWYYDFDRRSAANSSVIDLDRVSSALSRVHTTLIDLNISASCSYRDIGYPQLSTTGSLGPLSKFPKLKRIEAPVPFLVGFGYDRHLEDMMPPSLETLVISEDLNLQEEYEWEGDEPLLEELLSWSRKWAVSAPKLRHLSFSLEQLEDEYGSLRRDLKDACNRAGVVLHVTHTTSRMFYPR